MAVEVREAEALVLVEEVLAHAALHASAHDVTPVAHEVAAEVAHGVHGHEAHADGAERAEDGRRPFREEAAREVAQDDREGEVNSRHHEGGDGIDGEQVPLRVVVGEELAVEPAANMGLRGPTGVGSCRGSSPLGGRLSLVGLHVGAGRH